MRNEKYQRLSDEEIIISYREGEEAAIGYIMEKYKNLVRKKAGSMFILGGDREDLIQEGMIGLFKAVRDYDVGRDINFFTFADLCISRQMYTAVQASNRQKHTPLNSYISLYSRTKEGSGEGDISLDLENLLASTQDSDPERMLIAQETAEQMEQDIRKELSSLEQQVFELHLTGMTYGEIAKVLGRDAKSTDNALQRLKMKIRKVLQNY